MSSVVLLCMISLSTALYRDLASSFPEPCIKRKEKNEEKKTERGRKGGKKKAEKEE
jgi:hypothetical protein